MTFFGSASFGQGCFNATKKKIFYLKKVFLTDGIARLRTRGYSVIFHHSRRYVPTGSLFPKPKIRLTIHQRSMSLIYRPLPDTALGKIPNGCLMPGGEQG